MNKPWSRLTTLFHPKKVPADTASDERVIRVTGMIHDACANEVIAKLLFYQMRSNTAPVVLEIDSPGGSFVATFAILDTMKFVRCQVRTECHGEAYGCAALILAAGARGHRRAARQAQLGFCQTVINNDSMDKLQVQFYLDHLNGKVVEELSSTCKKPEQQIAIDLSSERKFSLEEAVQYGLVDGELIKH